MRVHRDRHERKIKSKIKIMENTNIFCSQQRHSAVRTLNYVNKDYIWELKIMNFVGKSSAIAFGL